MSISSCYIYFFFRVIIVGVENWITWFLIYGYERFNIVNGDVFTRLKVLKDLRFKIGFDGREWWQ